MDKSKFYTNVEYISKDALKTKLNKEYKSEIWKEIIDYREKYSFNLPLLISKDKYVRITQTPWILQKEIKLISEISSIQANTITELFSKYDATTLFKNIKIKSDIADIQILLNTQGESMSRTVIENLIELTDEPVDSLEYLVLDIYKKLDKLGDKIYSPREVAKKFFNFKNFPENKKNQFEDIHASLMDTIKSQKIHSLITKISGLIYGIISNNLFGDVSSEVAKLTIYSLLRSSPMTYILNGLSLLSVFDYYKYEIHLATERAIKDGGDITYLLEVVGKILLYCVNNSKEQIDRFIQYSKRYDNLSLREKAITGKSLLQRWPTLSEKEAKFYVAHNDKMLNYSLMDFRKFINCSYETSRYSMNNLVELGFYKKTKISKKYVYKPIR